MSDTLIRPLEENDRDAWNVLWGKYLAFYEQELPEAVTEDLFARLLGTGGHDGLVAARAGRLVGFVHYLPHDSTWSLKPKCYLEDLFVDEHARGTGAGRKLIEAVYAEADRCGWSDVYWHTHDDNTTARQLYDRAGALTKFVKYVRP